MTLVWCTNRTIHTMVRVLQKPQQLEGETTTHSTSSLSVARNTLLYLVFIVQQRRPAERNIPHVLRTMKFTAFRILELPQLMCMRMVRITWDPRGAICTLHSFASAILQMTKPENTLCLSKDRESLKFRTDFCSKKHCPTNQNNWICSFLNMHFKFVTFYTISRNMKPDIKLKQ